MNLRAQNKVAKAQSNINVEDTLNEIKQLLDDIAPILTDKQVEQINRMNVASQRADMGDVIAWLLETGGGGKPFTEDEIKQFVEEKVTDGTLTDLLIANGLYSFGELLNVLENSQPANQLFVNSASSSVLHDGKYLTPYLTISDAINGSSVANKNLVLLGTDTYTSISQTENVSSIIGEQCSINTVSVTSKNVVLKLFKINTSLDVYSGENIQIYVDYCAGDLTVHTGANRPTIFINKLDGNIVVQGEANTNPCVIYVKSWNDSLYTITADPTNLVSGSTIGNHQYGMIAES